MAVHWRVGFSVLYFWSRAHGTRLEFSEYEDDPRGSPGEESAVDFPNVYRQCVADCRNETDKAEKVLPTSMNFFGCEARCKGVLPVCVYPCAMPRTSLSLDVDCKSVEEARRWAHELVARTLPPTVPSKAYDSRCPRVNCDTEVVFGAAKSSYECSRTRQISEREVERGMNVSAYVHVPSNVGPVKSDEPVDAKTVGFADKCKDGMNKVVTDCLDILFVHPTTGNTVIQGVPLTWVLTEGFADAARKCNPDVTERLAGEMGQRMADRVAVLATQNKCGRCKLRAEGGTLLQVYMDDKTIQLSATCAACPREEPFGFQGYCRRCPEQCTRCDPSVKGKFVCVTSSKDKPTNHDLSCDEDPVLVSGILRRLGLKNDEYAHTCEFVGGGL
eukprot:CAMPEP_0179237306 /NCGR_PEP_ID=MMETSP0797-20121207/14372_1 /TAXON_ID=47934 /ORGANISM="Dinophysis acuminata, Strain DAEP01" /LENGTH=386 /DNA_ID=CAMNT_0020944583 /DNA_START=42 /DNA_END=1202 /DNA_ORIENTATION=-